MPFRLLVVDDDEVTLQLYVAELRAAGYEVTGTTSPNQALELAIAQKPDAIVMDILMPEMDGYELARLVRSYASTRGIRLVAVSGRGLDLSPGQTPPGGWDGYAGKPLEPGTLPRLVTTVLSAEITSVNRTGPVAVPVAPPSSRNGKNGAGSH